MKRSIGLFIIFVLAVPLASIAAEPAWWTQKKRECGISMPYNSWVSQGMPCNKGSSSSSGSSPAGNIGTILGTFIGNAMVESIRGNPKEDARRAAEAQALASEEKRRAEEQVLKQQKEKDHSLKQEEVKKHRLLGNMMGVGDSSQLGLMGADSGPGLGLITDDPAEQAPALDPYRAWEKYKRDVLAYQEFMTKNNPKNKENQRWCESRIPLSTGTNRVTWEARCNPDGHVEHTGNVAAPALPVENAATRAVASTPALKDPAVAPTGSDEQAKTNRGGFISKGPVPGNPGVVARIPEAFPAGAAPVAATPALKAPPVAPAGSDEQVKTAAQGGFDSKDQMLGTPGTTRKIPGTFPVAAAPIPVAAPVPVTALVPVAAPVAAAARGVTTATGVRIKPPMLPKETPSHVERQLITRNQTEPAPGPPPGWASSFPSQEAVAEKQTQALSCAISEFRDMANGMGEEGASLRAELTAFLDTIRVELSKPCSGQPEANTIQTISLSALTKGAKKKEDHLEGVVLVTREEKTCEVHLDVQHASSLKNASSSRTPGQAFNEGQSNIRMDKDGKIIIAETPAGVERCLARLSTKGQ